MQYGGTMQTYIHQLQTQIQQQNQRILQLEQAIGTLQKQMNSLKEAPSTKIDRIEYKFDQLKIETLEGTLNIGLNPLSPDHQIEDFSISQSDLTPPNRNAHIKELGDEIYEETLTLLEGNGHDWICDLAREKGINLHESYYDFITEDIKKQLEERILFHLQQQDDEQPREEKKESIKTQITQDMKRGIDAFLTHLPQSFKGAEK